MTSSDARDASGGPRRLSQEHRAKVIRFLRRHVRDEEVAEDLAQETLLRGYRSLDRLRDPQSLDGWLLRIAYHIAMDWHRRGRFQVEAQGIVVADEDASVAISPAPAGLQHAHDRREWSRRLREALGRLGPLDRVLVVAHYFVGHSCREIAGRSGLSLENVKVRLHRSRRRLRQWLPLEADFRDWAAAAAAPAGGWPRGPLRLAAASRRLRHREARRA